MRFIFLFFALFLAPSLMGMKGEGIPIALQEWQEKVERAKANVPCKYGSLDLEKRAVKNKLDQIILSVDQQCVDRKLPEIHRNFTPDEKEKIEKAALSLQEYVESPRFKMKECCEEIKNVMRARNYKEAEMMIKIARKVFELKGQSKK